VIADRARAREAASLQFSAVLKEAPAVMGGLQSGVEKPNRSHDAKIDLGCAGGELAEDLSHCRCLLEQWPVTDWKIAADHTAIAIDQAMRYAVQSLGEPPRRWRCGATCLQIHTAIFFMPYC
jgi:hypothetical protein